VDKLVFGGPPKKENCGVYTTALDNYSLIFVIFIDFFGQLKD
jgi:hypothetical protein